MIHDILRYEHEGEDVKEESMSLWNELFFEEKRVGKDGELFSLYKIRTMVHNACENLPKEIINGYGKEENDPRIIQNRKWMRRWGVDEIPQIINIIKGEMAFFGPRPLVSEIFDKIPEESQRKRTRVKPGIFGQYAFYNKGGKERTILESNNIYLHLREKKEKNNKSMIPFNTWIFVNAVKAILEGVNK